MQLQATETSQILEIMMTEDQIKQAIKNRNLRPSYDIIIQNDSNLGSQNIYISFGVDAVAGESIKIIPDAVMTFSDVNLSDTNIIADGATPFVIEFN